jgi:LysM repeat protein
MRRIVVLLFIVFSLQNATGQDQDFEMVRHQVQMGETVRMISRKYKVEPAEIYRLNKFAIDGIRQGMVLQIMVPRKEEPVAETVVENTEPVESSSVASSETTKNPDDDVTTTTTKTVTTTIKRKKTTTETQTSSEPIPDAAVSESSKPSRETELISHTVEKGETLFSIAKKYNVTMDNLKSSNEKLVQKGLQPGQILMINLKSDSSPVLDEASISTGAATVGETHEAVSANAGAEIKHKVEKGETLYSLSKKYNVAVEDIKAQNEQLLTKGLQVGQVLTIKANN